MVTVVNSPGPGETESSGVGLVIGVLLAIVVIVLFFIYGLPALRTSQTQNQTPQNTSPGGSNIQINVPNPLAPTGSSTSGTQ